MEAKYGALNNFVVKEIIKDLVVEANKKYGLELTIDDVEKAIASEFDFIHKRIIGATKGAIETFPKAIWLEYLGTWEFSEKKFHCANSLEYRRQLQAINKAKKEL